MIRLRENRRKVVFGAVGLFFIMAVVIIMVDQLVLQGKAMESVTVVSAERGDIKQKLDVSGTIQSLETRTYFSPVNAEIQEMDLNVGDVVKKGQQLVVFDMTELEKEYEKAKLNVKSGKNTYGDAVKQADQIDDKVDQARSNVDQLQASIDEWQDYVYNLQNEILRVNEEAKDSASSIAEEAAAKAAALEGEIAQAERNAEEKYELYVEAKTAWDIGWNGSLADEFYLLTEKKDSAEFEYETAQDHLENKQAELEQLTDGVDSTLEGVMDTMELQQELESASAYLAELKGEQASEKAIGNSGTSTLTKEARDNMKIVTDVASLDAKSLEKMVNKGKQGIQAEFGGIVSDMTVTKGAMATQGMQLFTIHSSDDICVEVNISKDDFDKVEKGQKADITLADREYRGSVTNIEHMVLPDATGNTYIKATVKVDDPDEKIFIGVDAKVVIYLEEVDDVITIPVEALNIDSEGSFCYVVEDGTVVRKEVKTGASTRESIQITEGLAQNAQVIVDMGTSKVDDRVIAKIAREE